MEFQMRNILLACCLSLATAPTLAVADAAPTKPAAKQVAATTATTTYTTEDTDIGSLLDDPAAAAIIDKHMPGFSTNPETELARGMTLKQIQPYAADTITDELLKSMDADFAALATKRK